MDQELLEEIKDIQELRDDMCYILSMERTRMKLAKIARKVNIISPDDILEEEVVPMGKEAVLMASGIWLTELLDVQERDHPYLFQPTFWQVVQLPGDLYAGFAPFFDHNIALVPVHIEARNHWMAVAIMNPDSIFKHVEELDVQSYPIIVAADSLPNCSFGVPEYQLLRNWVYNFAKFTYPERELWTNFRFAKLPAPLQVNPLDSGHHMLHSIHQIYTNRPEILALLPWDSAGLLMRLDVAPDVWAELWRPDVMPQRRAVRRKQLEVCSLLVRERMFARGSQPDNPISVD